jgi:Cu/Ag efflux pump CusA
MLWWWGVNMSVAVWVGFLVLFGVVDDGVVMSTYLEDVFVGRPLPPCTRSERQWSKPVSGVSALA